MTRKVVEEDHMIFSSSKRIWLLTCGVAAQKSPTLHNCRVPGQEVLTVLGMLLKLNDFRKNAAPLAV